MSLRVIALVACFLGSAVLTQNIAAADETKPAASKPAADQATPKSEPTKEPAAPAGKPTKDDAGSPQRFTPSEQVRADFDVSFPVDI